MGKFIIKRTALGDQFILRSDSGRTLAVSRHYATLDACKKGIASLVIHAPLMPVVDTTQGEYGPNPKFEIVSAKGGVAYLVKSPNGKTVITSPDYATKKACLRAISMLRTGVLDCEILLYSRARYTPIVMKALEGITAAAAKTPPQPPKEEHPEVPMAEPVSEPVEELAEEPVDVAVDLHTPEPEAPVAHEPAPAAPDPAPTRPVGMPRLIRLQPTAPAREKPAAQKSEGERTLGVILGRFFKK